MCGHLTTLIRMHMVYVYVAVQSAPAMLFSAELSRNKTSRSSPNQLSFPRPLGQFGDNCPGLNHRYDHGLFASKVTVLSEVPDAQISVLQKER